VRIDWEPHASELGFPSLNGTACFHQPVEMDLRLRCRPDPASYLNARVYIHVCSRHPSTDSLANAIHRSVPVPFRALLSPLHVSGVGF